MEKILVIQTAFIGDVILATPVLEALHQAYPKAEIYMVVKSSCETLFTNHPYVQEVFIYHKNKNKLLNLLALHKKIRKHKFDLAVNLHRFFTSGLLTVLSGAKVKIGFRKNPLSFLFTHKYQHIIGDVNVHEKDRNLSLIEGLVNTQKAHVKLYPSIFDYEQTKHYKAVPYICIAPTSAWFTKQMPIAKWVELINAIDEQFTIYLIGHKSDKDICEKIKKQTTHPKVIILAGMLEILQSAALMQDAVMNYVNDSGPMHLATAVNAPTTAVFCSTSTSFGFTPLSDTHFIIEAEPAPDCKPCGMHGLKKCPKGHFKCGNNISLQQLLEPLADEVAKRDLQKASETTKSEPNKVRSPLRGHISSN